MRGIFIIMTIILETDVLRENIVLIPTVLIIIKVNVLMVIIQI